MVGPLRLALARKALTCSFDERLQLSLLADLNDSYRPFAMLDSVVDISRPAEGPWHCAVVELAELLQHHALLVMGRVLERRVELRASIWPMGLGNGFFDLSLHGYSTSRLSTASAMRLSDGPYSWRM